MKSVQKKKPLDKSMLNQLQDAVKRIKLDLNDYRIWWLDPEEFERVYDKRLMSSSGKAIMHDERLMPRFVYDEIQDLMWDEKYKSVGLSIPDEYGHISKTDWGDSYGQIARNIIDGDLVGSVGILVRKDDVTPWMRDNGFVTNHMVIGELVTRPSEQVCPVNPRVEYEPFQPHAYVVMWVSANQAKSLITAVNYEDVKIPLYVVIELEAIDSDLPRLIRVNPILSVDPDCDELEDLLDNTRGKVMGTNGVLMYKPDAQKIIDQGFGRITFTDIDGMTWSNNNRPVTQSRVVQDGHLVWWLFPSEAEAILGSIADGDVNLFDGGPDYIWDSLDQVRNRHRQHTPGKVHLPVGLNVDPLDPLLPKAVEPNSIDGENDVLTLSGREGILINALDLEFIAALGGKVATIAGKPVKTLLELDGPPTAKDHPVLVWWLNNVQVTTVKEGIKDGSINLPGYINDEIRSIPNRPGVGVLLIPPHLKIDLCDLTEYDPVDFTNFTGIAFQAEDVNSVQKFCGELTTLDMARYDPSMVPPIHLRPLTEEEIRDRFIEHLNQLADYWVDQYPNDASQAARGAIFSTLVTIDGNSGGHPGYHLVPMGNLEDNEYLAENGSRPWPVPNIGKSIDIAGSLHSDFNNRRFKPAKECEFWVTKKEWKDAIATQRWAYIVEVLIRETPFVRARFETEHAGVVLGNVWRELCGVCLANGAYFQPEDYDSVAEDYSFKWATDDEEVFEKMLAACSGYTLMSHF